VHLELNGTKELDLVLAGAPSSSAQAPPGACLQSVNGDESQDAAIASSRWATGFSQ